MLSDIAEIQMKIAAMQAALIVFKDGQKDKGNEPTPMKEYFGGPKKEENVYATAKDLLCECDKDSFEAVAHAIVNGDMLKEKTNLVPSQVVNIDVSDTDSVLSEKEQEEQDRLFDRVVVESHMTAEEKEDNKKVQRLRDKPGSIRWYRFNCKFAMREEDWHSDIGFHLQEEVQTYLDEFMDNGGIITESSLTRSGEYGDES